jgi:aspartyl/asparaginyl beta-hydroxylase (cupin superfamily)
VIRHVVGVTASHNLEDERLGFANRMYRFVYQLRQPMKRSLKRLKKANRPVYYVLRWGALAGALYLVLVAGSGVLR